MSLQAALLVLTAALLHACWNFATRKSQGSLPVLWLSLLLAGLAFLPVSVVAAWGQKLTWAGVGYLAATSGIHAVYFPLLAAAYRAGQISLVYPVARGTGVAGTAALAFAAGIDPFKPLAAGAILCVCAGIFLIGLRRGGDGGRAARWSMAFALGVGAAIVMYSLADKLAVSTRGSMFLPPGGLHPLVYIDAVFLGTAILMAPYVWRRASLAGLRSAMTGQKRYILSIGPVSLCTYLLILFAYQMGPLSSVVAMREFSVVIGSVMGFVLLKEPVTARRIAGIGLVTAGMVLLKAS